MESPDNRPASEGEESSRKAKAAVKSLLRSYLLGAVLIGLALAWLAGYAAAWRP